jgi:hypothetical protein
MFSINVERKSTLQPKRAKSKSKNSQRLNGQLGLVYIYICVNGHEKVYKIHHEKVFKQFFSNQNEIDRLNLPIKLLILCIFGFSLLDEKFSRKTSKDRPFLSISEDGVRFYDTIEATSGN